MELTTKDDVFKQLVLIQSWLAAQDRNPRVLQDYIQILEGLKYYVMYES